MKSPGWANYIIGVASLLQKNYSGIKGFELSFSGNIPVGAGLSSSAALEVAAAVALINSFDIDIETPEIAKICQQAEWDFAVVQCGIMDQMSSLIGKRNHGMLLDCRSLEM